MSIQAERRRMRVSLPLPTGPRPVLRAVAVGLTLGLAALLWRRPETALIVLWGVLVPLLPLWWFVAPGAWRNVCPMAAANQLPRALGLSRARPLPAWLRQYGYLIALALFLFVLVARKAGLDDDGRALAILLVVLLASACVGGSLVAGKSGWCGSLCPLRPVQGLYAQDPVLPVASACQPCVGCQSDCPDLGRDNSQVRATRPDGAGLTRQRALTAGLLPGLIVGFYTSGDSLAAMPTIALCVLAGLGAFFVLENVGRLSLDFLTLMSAAVSLNLFYWFNAPLLVGAAAELLPLTAPDATAWLIRENVLVLTLVSSLRAVRRMRAVPAAAPAAAVTMVRGIPVIRRDSSSRSVAPAPATITVMPENHRLEVLPQTTLAEALDQLGLGDGAGCGLGLCGNDPVFVLAGGEYLSLAEEAERHTLARLELPENARLACSTRVMGDVEISLTAPPDPVDDVLSSTAAQAARAPGRFVVVGGGIAGVTAVEQLRRLAPAAEIDLIVEEDRPLYNRMALGELLHAPGELDRLHLRGDAWSSELGVRTWAGSPVTMLDPAERTVALAGGDRIPYDRLVLATGASASVLDVEGSDLPGVHVLRSADEASAIAAQIADGGVRRAVVVGGGPLGVETAASLRAGGLAVTLLERGDRLMRGHLDERAAELLAAAFADSGIEVHFDAEVRFLWGSGRLDTVVKTDGWTLPADMLVACVGVTPNAELARVAGLQVGRGVLVDDQLRTSDPHIFAVGDVAEHDGRPGSLWSPAEQQARVAARNALGEAVPYRSPLDVMRLKLPGIDVMTVGRPGEDPPILFENHARGTYQRLDATDGRLTGAVMVNAGRWERMARQAVEVGLRVDGIRASLTAGDWEVLRRGTTGVPADVAS